MRTALWAAKVLATTTILADSSAATKRDAADIGSVSFCVPPTGLEPVLLAPEANALSTELRGRISRILEIFVPQMTQF
jgi:hypothetical protein